MRRTLGAPVLVLLLGALLLFTGCGQDQTGDVTDDSAPTSDTTGSAEPDDEDDKEPLGEVEFELVEMITETAAGGKVDPQAWPLADVVAVQEFTKQFKTEAIQTRLTGLVESIDIPEGKALYGAVVAIGCETPPGVVVTSTDSGLTIEAQPMPSPPKECYAAMTSVALVLVDEEIVG
jgi:hypothetical protein